MPAMRGEITKGSRLSRRAEEAGHAGGENLGCLEVGSRKKRKRRADEGVRTKAGSVKKKGNGTGRGVAHGVSAKNKKTRMSGGVDVTEDCTDLATLTREHIRVGRERHSTRHTSKSTREKKKRD